MSAVVHNVMVWTPRAKMSEMMLLLCTQSTRTIDTMMMER
jgi:hypothetical protein